MYHDRAIELIMHAAAACMIPFTEDDAHALVRRMHPYTIPAGAWFLVEDERSGSDFVMLILSGDVVVESEIADGSFLTIGVLSPGRWVGELSMLDGQRRVAACRASDDADVVCAILCREEFLDMLDTEPHLAAKLTLLLASNMAKTLRDMHQKMCRYAEIQKALRTSL